MELELDKIFAIKSRDFYFFDRANIEYQAQLFQTTDALLKELRGSTKLYVKELAQDSATLYLEYSKLAWASTSFLFLTYCQLSEYF